ncbi:STP1 protein [Plasmodium ovale wallikeri]|uniref:STP1 protein n=1 Tax=Plasmodium ovale wallikeri TaxID=864142 RepID=A0A1A9AHF3_PLAOA|nr:STP1 protein [Plasmodium ovale wallikeri]
MAGDSGYATNLRVIPIDFFVDMIKDAIKTLIHTYGHKDCGLRHKELCEEIRKIIFKNKKILFHHMDPPSKDEWNTNWDKQRNGIFNKLFREEGFINMCYPFKNIAHQDLYQLLSRHVKFCIEKELKRSAVVAKPEFSECIKYNSWIDKQRTSFTLEYLKYVSKYYLPTVKKYFTTREHPTGYNPLDTYLNYKLNCTEYKSPPTSRPKIPVARAPSNSIHSPTSPTVRQKSQEKTHSSVRDGDSTSIKTKPKENIPPNYKPHIPNSQTSSPSKIQTGDTSTFQDTPVKTEDVGSPENKNGEKKESISIQGQYPTNSPPRAQAEASPLPPNVTIPTTATQNVPAATATTSLFSTPTTGKNTTSSQTAVTSPSLTITSDSYLNSGLPLPSNPHLPAADTKVQVRAPQSIIASGILVNTLPNQSLPPTAPADLSLSPPQDPVPTAPPVVNSAKEPGTSASSSANTVTTITTSSAAVTSQTMSTTKAPISYTEQAPSESSSQEDPHTPALSGPKTRSHSTEPQPALTQTPTSLSRNDTRGISVSIQPVTIDNNQQASLSSESSPITKDLIKHQGVQSANSITSHSEYTSNGSVVLEGVKLQKNVDQADQKYKTPVQIGTRNDNDQLIHRVNVDQGKISRVKPGKDLNNDPVTPIEKNDNPSIIPEGIPPLMHIIPTLLVILATVTLLFQLYKYTPFGFLLGRRRKRKKKDLKRIFETPQKPTYESPNIAAHELEDPNLVGKVVGNDAYTKLLKINRYKQEIQKRKKKNKKTLIEVHMEVFDEYKSDEWELHKGDFLEICLRGFINEENETYQKFPYTKLTINNIKNEKTIEDIQKQEILWNNWIENHRNILEQWKKEEWFHILKNKWRNEEQKYKEKNDKIQENTLNEQETHSIVSQKEIWKQWISKQATLIKMFNQEDWFKELVDEQNKEKNNYHINEYNNISVTNKTELKNEKMNHEQCKSKNIIQKLMVQIHMMVLEECIKDEIIRNKELRIDNFIEDIHNQNNYDQKRNVPQCDTDNFNVLKYDEIHTSRNK